MGIDLNNMNQILSKSEFFAINVIKASHESPNNNYIILKKVKTVLLPDKVTSLVKTRTIKNRLLLYRRKLYISKSMDNNLRYKNYPDIP